MSNNKTYCGVITIVGRSNVGKSTLLNKLLGQKISITSRKLQTTIHHIIGIHTKGKYQVIYVDTPGFYIEKKHIINHRVNGISSTFISNSIDKVIFVVEGTRWKRADRVLLNKLYSSKIPIILAVNKIDCVQKKTDLLPHLQFLANQMKFLEIVPISAKFGINIDVISSIVYKYLPEAIHRFPKECITDCSQRFMVYEIIREKIMRFLGAELPYLVSIKIEHFKGNKQLGYDVSGLILVKCKRHKKIIIGNKGLKIKTITIKSRKDMQEILGSPVRLVLWVKENKFG